MNREFIFIYEKETNSITTTSRHVRHNRTCANRSRQYMCYGVLPSCKCEDRTSVYG